MIYAYQRPSVLPAALTPKRVLGEVSVAQAQQVPAQLERILAAACTEVRGTSGFTGNGIQASKKHMDVRGVPPRGRPV